MFALSKIMQPANGSRLPSRAYTGVARPRMFVPVAPSIGRM